MDDILKEPLLDVAGRTYLWRDAVLGAALRGDWPELERLARAGLACMARAEAAGEGATTAEIEDGLTAFRYRHGLLSIDDMSAWFALWRLDADTLFAAIERGLLRERWSDDLEATLRAHLPADEALVPHLHAEAVYGGWLAAAARRLAERLAVHEAEREVEPGAGPASEPAALPPLARTWLGRETPPDPDRCLELARAEAVHRRLCAEGGSDAEIAAAIGNAASNWLRFACRSVVFPSDDAAREAALCLAEDGLDLAEVAAAARCTVHQTEFFLVLLAPALRPDFLSAPAGALIGPLAREDGHLLVQIVTKTLPRTDDPAVRAWASRILVGRRVDDEVAARIRWHHEVGNEDDAAVDFTAR